MKQDMNANQMMLPKQLQRYIISGPFMNSTAGPGCCRGIVKSTCDAVSYNHGRGKSSTKLSQHDKYTKHKCKTAC